MKRLICVLMVLYTSCTLAQDTQSPPPSETIAFLDYQINITHDPDHEKSECEARIIKNGQVLDKITDYFVDIANIGYLKFIGDSVLKPYAIFQTSNGGSHSPGGIVVYELTPTLKKIFTLEHVEGGGIDLVANFPGEGYLIKLNDPTFLYWHTCYSDSAHIPVYLQKNAQGTFEIRDEESFMDEESLWSLASTIYNTPKYWETRDTSPEPSYPGKLTENVVNLLYKKQPALALKFLDKAWNPKNPHKEQFKVELKEALKKSPYWGQLEKKGYTHPF